ncbi:MAG: chemotaxis protein CheA [Gammaproteobacteria bacterium]|nr:chemotaxis protein CheA [Gammaproteobacteria bacterium]
MSVDLEQFHQVFFEESFEGLDVMETGLMELDLGAADSEEINTIFRAAHSIKGGSGTFGFQGIADFTHVMETLLDEMRDGRREVTHDAVDSLLKSVDILRMMLNCEQDKKDPDNERIHSQLSDLESILAGHKVSGSLVEVTSHVTDGSSGITGWHIIFEPDESMMLTGNDPLRIIRELAELGGIEVVTCVDKLPTFADLQPESCYLSWEITLQGDISEDVLKDVFLWVEDECKLTLEPISNAKENDIVEAVEEGETENQVDRKSVVKNESKSADSGDQKKSTGSSSIRVGIDKIDDLINMVGELVITQSMLSLLGEDFSMKNLEKLQDGLGQLERHTRELQESVMMIRMLPISFSFSRFPRLVRDLSSQMGKKINLVMSGENTEIDKTLIEKIGDPLVHLVRNSLDHGIEMPEDRVAAGKDETGTIHLNAYHKGGNIVIEITDDGKGIDQDAVLNKAIEKGLVADGASLSTQQINDLIFQPGFSTAKEVTDVSGRGVGMDVVRKNISSLGGAVEIQSEYGVGSTFTIRLPLTLAILDGQTVIVGDEIYIVPLVSIVESIQIKSEMINKVAGRCETFKLRDEYIPIVRLSSAFGIENTRAKELEEGLLVVVEADRKPCGLFVDDLLGQQQVVIKSLEQNYQRVDGISGATILGDGSVALILDIPGLLRMSVRH